ncbi:MAG TPA: CUAEP/CCAEP-tail radical SAM protein [Candidatus Methylomirabilis sp.]|nr:CUAEP/CCAEP-tail radical SAM protein [Candidatus Methylomirabilis sp.]
MARPGLKVVLISTYELGRQPFGLASPAAWLGRTGAAVRCLDTAVESPDEEAIRDADLVAFHVPMHTATRLAIALLPRVRRLNPHAHLCFYGLYAPVNEGHLRALGAGTILGGEFEAGLAKLVRRLSGGGNGGQVEPVVSLDRQRFLVPDRVTLPPLSRYAHLNLGDGQRRTVGYTEASRGCKHLCRHCPIVPVYAGRFRVVQPDVVLEDIRRQVAAGARHISFGDPDFWNGIGHAMPLVQALHAEHPDLTYDVTIKIGHLLTHRRHLTTLRDTGCLFVTSAAESVDDRVLALLDKGHSRRDFEEVVRLLRETGLTLHPTFVAFTPWTSLPAYLELLEAVARLDLVEQVAPIQLALRLLIPAGSRLLDLPETLEVLEGFDPVRLSYRWRHPDPRVDRLQEEVQGFVQRAEATGTGRREIFEGVWGIAARAAGLGGRCGPARPPGHACAPNADRPSRPPIPYMSESWYC